MRLNGQEGFDIRCKGRCKTRNMGCKALAAGLGPSGGTVVTRDIFLRAGLGWLWWCPFVLQSIWFPEARDVTTRRNKKNRNIYFGVLRRKEGFSAVVLVIYLGG